jgi:hypothetical protein
MQIEVNGTETTLQSFFADHNSYLSSRDIDRILELSYKGQKCRVYYFLTEKNIERLDEARHRKIISFSSLASEVLYLMDKDYDFKTAFRFTIKKYIAGLTFKQAIRLKTSLIKELRRYFKK